MVSVAVAIAAPFIIESAGVAIGTAAVVIATAGALYVDQQFLLPHLFPQDLKASPLPLPRFADEGGGANYPIGTVRVPCQYIWLGPFKDHIHRANGTTKVPTFKVSAALAAARWQDATDAAAFNFLKLYGNGTEIWVTDAFKTITLTSNDPNTQMSVERPRSASAGGVATMVHVFHSTANGPDLTRLHIGVRFTSAGWTKPKNIIPNTPQQISHSIIFDVRRIAGGITTMAALTFFVRGIGTHPDLRETPASGGTKTLTQVAPNIRKLRAEFVQPRSGAPTDPVDAIIKADVDPNATNIPAHRFTAYIRVDGMLLYDFGNRPPQIEALVKRDAADVAAAVRIIMKRTNLREDIEYDVSELVGLAFTGLSINGLEPAAKSLEPIMLANDILTQIRLGKIHFFERKNATVVECKAEDLGAYEEGDEPPEPMHVEPISPALLPTEVMLTYANEDEEHIESSVSAKVISPNARFGTSMLQAPKTENKKFVNLSRLVMTQKRAREIAERLLWAPQGNREKCSGVLPPSYWHLLENDVLRITPKTGQFYGRGEWRILLNRVDKGQNGLVEWEGVTEISAMLIPAAAEPQPKRKPNRSAGIEYRTPLAGLAMNMAVSHP